LTIINSYDVGRIQHECTLRSMGSVNKKVNEMYQNLISNECALNSPLMWPADFGPVVFKQCKTFSDFFFLSINFFY